MIVIDHDLDTASYPAGCNPVRFISVTVVTFRVGGACGCNFNSVLPLELILVIVAIAAHDDLDTRSSLTLVSRVAYNVAAKAHHPSLVVDARMMKRFSSDYRFVLDERGSHFRALVRSFHFFFCSSANDNHDSKSLEGIPRG